MPFIEIREEDLSADALNPMRLNTQLISLMRFPNDAMKREDCIHHMNAFYREVHNHTLQQLSLDAPRLEPYTSNDSTPLFDVGGLDDAPPAVIYRFKEMLALLHEAEFIKKKNSVHDVILNLWRLAVHEHKEPSKKKAVYLASAYASKYQTNALKNRESINQAWEEYKSVAHLLAAERVARDMNLPEAQLMHYILSLALQIQDFITTYIPKRAHAPLIDLETIWQVPAHLSLPDITYTPAKFSDEEKVILAAFKSTR